MNFMDDNSLRTYTMICKFPCKLYQNCYIKFYIFPTYGVSYSKSLLSYKLICDKIGLLLRPKNYCIAALSATAGRVQDKGALPPELCICIYQRPYIFFFFFYLHTVEVILKQNRPSTFPSLHSSSYHMQF